MGSASMCMFTTSFAAVVLLIVPLNVGANQPPMAAEGVVFCKPCKNKGIDTLTDASPLPGVSVNLTCVDHNRWWHQHLIYNVETDANGYFLVRAGYLANFNRYECYVELLTKSLQVPECENLTDLNNKDGKVHLKYKRPSRNAPFNLYTVGPFAYEPSKCS